jgi:hypothetical protein
VDLGTGDAALLTRKSSSIERSRAMSRRSRARVQLARRARRGFAALVPAVVVVTACARENPVAPSQLVSATMQSAGAAAVLPNQWGKSSDDIWRQVAVEAPGFGGPMLMTVSSISTHRSILTAVGLRSASDSRSPQAWPGMKCGFTTLSIRSVI